MKKILTLVLILVLISSVVFAAGKDDDKGMMDDSDNGIMEDNDNGMIEDDDNGVQGQRMGEEEQKEMVKAQTKTELNAMIQQKKQDMDQELQGLGKSEQKVYQNQNEVRLAVHSLLAMEGLIGGIGPQVSEIARNFNNSVQATIKAEENIEKRSALARFFAGGDVESADEIEQQVTQNLARIQELNQLREECDCDEEVKATLQEQIQNMEQEQERLQELAQKEKQSKGLLGWLWK